ncbi:MAG: hypothetical protein H0V45_11695 [Actinobacteria bacterium]|nr:hypothetical protein [Actinomycetota bacterium]
MRFRLLAVALVLGAALADGAGLYAVGYYALVAAVPVAAVAALIGLGAILDRTAAEPLDWGSAVLSALALPFLLLATAVRASLAGDNAPPTIGVTALVVCLVLFALQAVLSGAAALGVSRPAALEAD